MEPACQPTPRALSVAILAGGRARRMGGEKAGQLLAGRTLLERVLEVARSCSDDVLLLPRERSLVLPDGPPPRAVPDHPALDGQGPLAGLAGALAAARHPWCLLLGCDLPFARADVARLLLALGTDAQAPAVLPVTAQALQPFHGLWRTSLLPRLLAWAAGGGRSLTGFARHVGALEVPAGRLAQDGGRFLQDVDTPRELALAREVLS